MDENPLSEILRRLLTGQPLMGKLARAAQEYTSITITTEKTSIDSIRYTVKGSKSKSSVEVVHYAVGSADVTMFL